MRVKNHFFLELKRAITLPLKSKGHNDVITFTNFTLIYISKPFIPGTNIYAVHEEIKLMVRNQVDGQMGGWTDRHKTI